ncbi:MAG: ATP synthase F1 subunit gamma [Bacteroidales bacterium]|nr:ATP synthase F1 subunit gamma [Bacteroidales bacterium]
MASLKEIRVRITSVTSTRQITSAMKMVSAARLRKAQDAIIQMRPYANKLHDILSDLSANMDQNDDNPYGQQRNPERVLIVAVSSNRGLCGGFNSAVAKRIMNLLESDYAQQYQAGKVDIITFGKKAGDLLRFRKIAIKEMHPEIYEDLSFEHVATFATVLMEKFLSNEYDRIDLVYNQFKNAASQVLTHEQFLPVRLKDKSVKANKQKKNDYIFEPSKDFIVNELIPKSLRIQFYKAVLDSNAAEHGARMTAMHKATDNASDMIRELKLHYNKARQAAITNEILEVVGGADALG